MQQLFIPANGTHWNWDQIIPTLVGKANIIKQASTDYVADDIHEISLKMVNPNKLSWSTGSGEYALTDFATSQFCQKIDFPVIYYRKVLSDERLRHRLAGDINAFLNISHTNIMLRTTNNIVRGVLSNKYVSFDTDRILDVFTDTVSNYRPHWRSNLMFRGCYTDLDWFHLRFTTNVPIANLQDSSPIYAGLELDSSDVGRSKLNIRFYLYRQVCGNGMCLPMFNKDFYVQKHLGITPDDLREGTIKSINAFDNITAMATEIIQQSENIAFLEDSPVFDLDENPFVMKRLMAYFRMSESEMGEAMTLFRDVYPHNVWGFTNAITQKARDFSFDRRNTIEWIAGNFLKDYKKLEVI